MAVTRTMKSLVGRRRRVGEESEDEDGPVNVQDSQSEGSELSGAEADGIVGGSSVDDVSAVNGDAAQSKVGAAEEATNGSRTKKLRKLRKKGGKAGADDVEIAQPQQQASFDQTADTAAMMNGLKISNQNGSQEEAVDFEAPGQVHTPSAPNGHPLSPIERQRREHEEYKKKRDSNPAFIPNRGSFFMHDTRGQPNGQPPPPRGVWQARGRGRGGANAGGPFSPVNQMAQTERAAEQPWKHDLHDSINEEPQAQSQPAVPNRHLEPVLQVTDSSRLFPKAVPPRAPTQPRIISFDKTTVLGTIVVRLALPGMKAPITFSEVPVKSYLRLPMHRPPLRRDKPVRISVPGHQPHYVFPQTDRSFVFIPRQNRPNHQSLHRGSYSRSVGGYGYSSRRTSMYGGSIYSGSVVPSRRGSLASISRENAFSPVGAFGMPNNRPVVRLPHGGHPFSASSTPLGPLSGHHTPVGVPPGHGYPNYTGYSLPQPPLQHGTPSTMVHQPTPQKPPLSVAGIESPALLQNVPAEPQPFQNQLPAHMNEQPSFQQPPSAPYFSPRQQYQYPGQQPQAGTPLSGIPEQSMQAPNFPPPPYGQPPPYYANYPPGQNYYYGPQAQHGYSPMPMYMPPPPQNYMNPPQQPAAPAPQTAPEQEQASAGSEHHQQSQSGMVAHESNGMVFYVPASEAQQSDHYQPAEGFVPSYAMPGLAPPTPAPENHYYYPPMPHSGMQDVGTAMYYPAQQ